MAEQRDLAVLTVTGTIGAVTDVARAGRQPPDQRGRLDQCDSPGALDDYVCVSGVTLPIDESGRGEAPSPGSTAASSGPSWDESEVETNCCGVS